MDIGSYASVKEMGLELSMQRGDILRHECGKKDEPTADRSEHSACLKGHKMTKKTRVKACHEKKEESEDMCYMSHV